MSFDISCFRMLSVSPGFPLFFSLTKRKLVHLRNIASFICSNGLPALLHLQLLAKTINDEKYRILHSYIIFGISMCRLCRGSNVNKGYITKRTLFTLSISSTIKDYCLEKITAKTSFLPVDLTLCHLNFLFFFCIYHTLELTFYIHPSLSPFPSSSGFPYQVGYESSQC